MSEKNDDFFHNFVQKYFIIPEFISAKLNHIFFHVGIIRHLELMLQTPVHWIICMLHMNELPLRKLFILLDGVQIGPDLYSGPIGELLLKCFELPVVKFKRIVSDDFPVLSDEVLKDLSTDQKYLYEICHAVQSGCCPPSLTMIHCP